MTLARLALFVGLGAFAAYAGSFRPIQTIDSTTNVLVAYSLVRDRDAYLDEFEAHRDRLSYWSLPVGVHQVSPYPPGAALVGVPFAAVGTALGVTPPNVDAVMIFGRLAAAAAAAASVAVVFLAAARLAGARRAVVVAGLYGLGTATWPISAGALWQHGPAQLCLAIGLLALLPSARGPRLALAGAAFALATLARIPDGLFLVAAGGSVLLAYGPRAAARYAIGAAGPLAALLAYQSAMFGTPFDTGYAAYNFRAGLEPVVGIIGNLVSPGRGLLVYSPFIAAGIIEVVRRSFVRDALAVVLRGQLLAAAGILVLYASQGFLLGGGIPSADWWGGSGYGNRYLADALPLLSLGVALWLRRPHARATWIAFMIASAWSIALALVGAFFYDWQEWSWEGVRSARELAWRLDPPPWIYAAGRANLDAVTIASFGCVAAAAAVLVRAYAMAPMNEDRQESGTVVC